VRVIVNFQSRLGIWAVNCLLEDARTPISAFITMKSYDTLVRLLRYVGATDAVMAEVERDHRRWGRGTLHIEILPGRKNLLRIRQPWNANLQ
jgi:hypothetical protein